MPLRNRPQEIDTTSMLGRNRGRKPPFYLSFWASFPAVSLHLQLQIGINFPYTILLFPIALLRLNNPLEVP
jgi:hypothetical protein